MRSRKVASLADRPFRVAVSGATGATGRLVVQQIDLHPGLRLCGALAAPTDPALGQSIAPGVQVNDDARMALRDAQLLIDFSAIPAVESWLPAVEARPLPLVVGTTGLPQALRTRLTQLASAAPVLLAPNMSIGVQILRQLVRQAAGAVGPGWDAEIVEIHHRRKVDAPSGTALALAEDIARAAQRGTDAIRSGRSGATGARPDDEIGVQAVRGGDVVGEHTVMFLGTGERIELIHRATDRSTFAAGAVRAAHWLLEPGRRAGLYGMEDVL